MKTIASHEARIRRSVARAGHRLVKTPSRHWTRPIYGSGYMVIDRTNTVVLGSARREYDATLAEAEEFAASL